MPAINEREAAERVRERIAAACARSGRDPAAVTLVAAAKTVSAERILAAGVTDVGENRVQELLAKMGALQGRGLRWHFIGSLQRNKVHKVVGEAVLIHSLDSLALAKSIAAAARDRGITQDVLIQVNVSGEPSKSGVNNEDDLLLFLAAVALDGLRVRGLMCIPAPGPPESARPAFRRLAAMAREYGLEHLSMGMSGDFEVAVEEGATIVRVGAAIFGERPGR